MPVLAVDLGGTELRAALVDQTGAFLAAASTTTDAQGGPAAVVEQIAALVAPLRSHPTAACVTRLGIAAPGPLDPHAGIVLAAPMLRGWVDVPLAALLCRRLALDVVLENDANAAALGEWRFGAGRGARSIVYVTISTGIGGGVIVDGALLHGRRGLAGEIGHMIVTQADTPCACGGSGCWEAVASGTALARAAGRPGQHVEAAARQGDAAALALLDAEACWLGIGLANLLHLYSPERLVMGGGVMACLDLMRPRIEATLRSRAMPAYRDVAVVAAELGGRAGLVGAAGLVL